MQKRSPTTKDVALLQQLYKSGQLDLAPEFQRNAVWPRKAKAYLIDTLLTDQPVPLFFLLKGRSAQTGLPKFSVVDGQQRLRAIFEYLEDAFALTESKDVRYKGKRFSELRNEFKNQILNYDLTVQELSEYTDQAIKDIFVRMNKYVVRLSPQELRNAMGKGAFHDFVTEIAELPFWRDRKIFSRQQIARMRPVEFAAELVILLVEGPQDKKTSVDLYYGQYRKTFPESSEIERKIIAYLTWLEKAIPNIELSRFRKPVDLYGLMGAIDSIIARKHSLSRLDPKRIGKALLDFEKKLKQKSPAGDYGKYLLAASRQTDNIIPRNTRIAILRSVIQSA